MDSCYETIQKKPAEAGFLIAALSVLITMALVATQAGGAS